MKSLLESSNHIEDEFGANLLHYAARNGNLSILQYLVFNCGLNPLLRSETGSLPAHEAAAFGKIEALAWLLKATKTTLFDRDHFGHTFLHIAARWVFLLNLTQAHIYIYIQHLYICIHQLIKYEQMSCSPIILLLSVLNSTCHVHVQESNRCSSYISTSSFAKFRHIIIVSLHTFSYTF